MPWNCLRQCWKPVTFQMTDPSPTAGKSKTRHGHQTRATLPAPTPLVHLLPQGSEPYYRRGFSKNSRRRKAHTEVGFGLLSSEIPGFLVIPSEMTNWFQVRSLIKWLLGWNFLTARVFKHGEATQLPKAPKQGTCIKWGLLKVPVGAHVHFGNWSKSIP